VRAVVQFGTRPTSRLGHVGRRRDAHALGAGVPGVAPARLCVTTRESRLDRFREAQNAPRSGFDTALDEIRTGGKRGHWIWYVFPQMSGLGSSSLSRHFAIDDEGEAAEFLRDSELRTRYLKIAHAVSEQLRTGQTLHALMGSDVDAEKLVSSLTLFEHVANKLSETDSADVYHDVATTAADILAVAASQGHGRCAHTLRRLGQLS
jgi:uncharacterized protein (DUF1810 family)